MKRKQAIAASSAVLGAVLLAAVLRFWQLGDKPLWLDEILTLLLSSGRGLADVPLGRLVAVETLPQALSPTHATCAEIARLLARESTHPPLFFCALHPLLRGWANLPNAWVPSLAWQGRSLSALFGVLAVAAMYRLGCRVGGHPTGWRAAALMAVSPFALYLSQEARHYTLPLLLVTLSLTALLDWVRHEVGNRKQGRSLPRGTRGLWVLANAVGLYVHYFTAIAYVAQALTLLGAVAWRRGKRWAETAIALFVLAVPGLLFLPWLPILIQHFSRPETDWFQPFEPSWTDGFAPIGQAIASWVLMVVAFPVESQPLWVAVPMAAAMLGFAGWLLRQAWRGLGDRPRDVRRQDIELWVAVSFVGWVLLAFVAIVYGLGKNITAAPRYHFIYYPAVCLLLAMGLSGLTPPASRRSTAIALCVGSLSCLCVVGGLAFNKPYYPRQLAQTFSQNATELQHLEVVVGYENAQEIALGLSFALELPPGTQFALFDRRSGYDAVWQALAQRPTASDVPGELWVVAPGLRQAQYPDRLLRGERGCDRDPDGYGRLGIPYQRYRCLR